MPGERIANLFPHANKLHDLFGRIAELTKMQKSLATMSAAPTKDQYRMPVLDSRQGGLDASIQCCIRNRNQWKIKGPQPKHRGWRLLQFHRRPRLKDHANDLAWIKASDSFNVLVLHIGANIQLISDQRNIYNAFVFCHSILGESENRQLLLVFGFCSLSISCRSAMRFIRQISSH